MTKRRISATAPVEAWQIHDTTVDSIMTGDPAKGLEGGRMCDRFARLAHDEREEYREAFWRLLNYVVSSTCYASTHKQSVL